MLRLIATFAVWVVLSAGCDASEHDEFLFASDIVDKAALEAAVLERLRGLPRTSASEWRWRHDFYNWRGPWAALSEDPFETLSQLLSAADTAMVYESGTAVDCSFFGPDTKVRMRIFERSVLIDIDIHADRVPVSWRLDDRSFATSNRSFDMSFFGDGYTPPPRPSGGSERPADAPPS